MKKIWIIIISTISLGFFTTAYLASVYLKNSSKYSITNTETNPKVVMSCLPDKGWRFLNGNGYKVELRCEWRKLQAVTIKFDQSVEDTRVRLTDISAGSQQEKFVEIDSDKSYSPKKVELMNYFGEESLLAVSTNK